MPIGLTFNADQGVDKRQECILIGAHIDVPSAIQHWNDEVVEMWWILLNGLLVISIVYQSTEFSRFFVVFSTNVHSIEKKKKHKAQKFCLIINKSWKPYFAGIPSMCPRTRQKWQSPSRCSESSVKPINFGCNSTNPKNPNWVSPMSCCLIPTILFARHLRVALLCFQRITFNDFQKLKDKVGDIKFLQFLSIEK